MVGDVRGDQVIVRGALGAGETIVTAGVNHLQEGEKIRRPPAGGVADPVNPAAIALRHKTSTLVFVVLIVVGGFLAYRGLSRLEDPEFTIKDAKVITAYPGATAQEVEEEVTDVVETAVKELGQIKHVRSTSTPGRSIVTVTIKDQYDRRTLPQVWDELRRKVNDAQGRLPPGAGPSLVLDDFGDVFGIFLALSGDGFSYAELRDAARLLQRELRLVPDVAKVTLSGLQRETIYLEISRARLASLGVPEAKIYAALAGKNLVGPSGAVEVGRERIRILPEPGFETVQSIGDVVIEGVGSGRQLFVRDVATITRDFEDPPANIVRLNGEPAVGLGISVISGGNVVIMGEAVKRRIAELKSRLPVGLELGIIYFQPDIVVQAINGFVVTLAEAVVIVIGVLVVSMGVRSGLLIGGQPAADDPEHVLRHEHVRGRPRADLARGHGHRPQHDGRQRRRDLGRHAHRDRSRAETPSRWRARRWPGPCGRCSAGRPSRCSPSPPSDSRRTRPASTASPSSW